MSLDGMFYLTPSAIRGQIQREIKPGWWLVRDYSWKGRGFLAGRLERLSDMRGWALYGADEEFKWEQDCMRVRDGEEDAVRGLVERAVWE